MYKCFGKIISASVHHNHTHKAHTEKEGWGSLNHCCQISDKVEWPTPKIENSVIATMTH